MAKFIADHGFGVLVTLHELKPVATHLPLVLSDKPSGEKILLGHVSKGNPQWKTFEGQTALAIFQGPHAYVSSSWYDHVNVPTWNYIAVHVYGKIRIIEGDELKSSLSRLVRKHEVVSANPVSVETMPEDFLRREMKGIVGFEMAIESMEGSWKLSQNRDDENFRNIISELENLREYNATLVAEEMRRLKK